MKVECPTCHLSVEWSSDNEFRPFCCKKCQLIDLGEWATESHVISTPAQTEPNSFEFDEEAIAAAFEQNPQAFFKE